MKYIVMECHKGYAVLMDEESRFVTAANLGYNVGDTINDPVLMSSGSEDASRRKIMITAKFVSIAACLTLLIGSGYLYYSSNYKTYSTVIISEADVKMSINKKGKVIKLESCNQRGEEIIKDYNAKGKDQLTAANEIIELGISKGYLSDGETVSLYVSDGETDKYDEISDDSDNNINKHNLKVSVHSMNEYDDRKSVSATNPVTTDAPPAPAVPEKPPAAPAAPQPAEPPHGAPLPDGNDKAVVPPTAPNADVPAPAEPPVKPDDNNVTPPLSEPKATEPAAPPHEPHHDTEPPSAPDKINEPKHDKQPDKDPIPKRSEINITPNGILNKELPHPEINIKAPNIP
ncbi:MAG: hypothetical protein IIY35_04790 [Ruminococcus sp.]|nr:hypothetical protein [Ruminococcus sp.]